MRKIEAHWPNSKDKCFMIWSCQLKPHQCVTSMSKTLYTQLFQSMQGINGELLDQRFPIAFPGGPWRTKASSKTDAYGPNTHHYPICFNVFWEWPNDKYIKLANTMKVGNEGQKRVMYEPNKHQLPKWFCVFWPWPNAKHEGLADKIWPVGPQFRTPMLDDYHTIVSLTVFTLQLHHFINNPNLVTLTGWLIINIHQHYSFIMCWLPVKY